MSAQLIAFIFFIAILLFVFFTAALFRYFGTGVIENKSINIVTVFNETDNVDDALSSMTEDLSAECISSGISIIIVDGGMSISQLEICNTYCEKYSFYIYSTPDKLSEIIFSLKNKKAV